MIVAVIVVLIVVVAFGVWALIRSAAEADKQIYKMIMEEEQDDGKTEREN